MASVNSVTLVGHLGRDPEMRTFPSGDQIANITIATTEKWKDKQSGEQKELTEWSRVVFNGRLAEVVGQYLRKGSLVYIEGSLRTRSYEKDGQKHYATEIRANQMQMLDRRQDGGGQGGYEQGGYDNGGGRGGYQDQGRGQQQPQGGGQGQQRGNGYQDTRGGNQQRGDQGQQRQAAPQNQQRQQPQTQQRTASGFEDLDDDIPF